MRPLVFGTVGTVGEGFITVGVLADVGLLAGMRPQMNFQVF